MTQIQKNQQSCLTSFCTFLSVLCFIFTNQIASANAIYGLNIGYAPAYGVLEQKSLDGAVRAILPRMVGGSAALFYQPHASRFRYLVQYALNYSLQINAVDFDSTSVGVQIFLYYPDMQLDGVVKTNERLFEPYLKVLLTHAQQSSSILNSTNENIEAVRISNLGLLTYAGGASGRWFAEGGVLAAPVSLSTPAFKQLWVMLTLGVTLSNQ